MDNYIDKYLLLRNSLIKIIILGDNKVGKSSIAHRFIYDTFNTSLPLSSKLKRTEIDGRSAVFSIVIYNKWDDVPFFLRQIDPNYLFSKTDGAIIVYDQTDENSLIKAETILESLKEYYLNHSAVILVGNKCEVMNEDVCILSDRAYQLAQIYKISYAEISARNGHNVEEVFKYLARIILRNRKIRDVKVDYNGESKIDRYWDLIWTTLGIMCVGYVLWFKV